jgi:hypothetical protein
MVSLTDQLNSILTEAAHKALPGFSDSFYVTPEKDKNKTQHYVCPSVMKVWNMTKKKGGLGFNSCKSMAQAVLNFIDPCNKLVESVVLSQVGKGDPEKAGYFLNIEIKDSFL